MDADFVLKVEKRLRRNNNTAFWLFVPLFLVLSLVVISPVNRVFLSVVACLLLVLISGVVLSIRLDEWGLQLGRR